MKDIEGNKVKEGQFVVRHCPCCDSIIDCGEVITRPDVRGLLLRDYERGVDTRLRAKLGGKVLSVEIIMEKCHV